MIHCMGAVKAPPYEYRHLKLIFFYYIISLFNRILFCFFQTKIPAQSDHQVKIMCLFQLKIFKVNYL